MKYVLFVCTQNAGRSQIAQAYFERHAPADVKAESAGQEPRGHIGPPIGFKSYLQMRRFRGVPAASMNPSNPTPSR